MTLSAQTHRAWRCHAFGDYHDLVLEPVVAAAPAAGEIAVAVAAFAPGFPDRLMVEGGYQLRPPLPFTPCAEFAGTVCAVGPEVTTFSVGDALMGTVRYGAAQERLVAPAAGCFPLPAGFDFAHGAAYLVAMKTAYVALVARGSLARGETLLVHGAAGGVGLAAVALARHLGARVIAMASGEAKLAVLRERGAHEVLDYRAGGFRESVKALTGGRGVDLVYDPVGGDVFDESLRCLAPFGRLLVVGFASGRIPSLPVNRALIKQLSVIGVRAGEFGRLDPAAGAAVDAALVRLAAEPALRPHLHAVLGGEALIEAYDRVGRREVAGRLVLRWRAAGARGR